MDYLDSGNNSDQVLGSGVTKMETTTTGVGLITLLTRLSKAMTRRTPEAVLGMKWRQFHALGYLKERDGVAQHELGEAFLMDDNGVVLLLNELEAAGLSVRRRDPEDRRRHLVDITPAGRQAYDRAEKARESIEEELLGELSPEERATLRKLLKRALDGLLRVPV
jgi:DNA-binding MarR family transcriptional regulator